MRPRREASWLSSERANGHVALPHVQHWFVSISSPDEGPVEGAQASAFQRNGTVVADGEQEGCGHDQGASDGRS